MPSRFSAASGNAHLSRWLSASGLFVMFSSGSQLCLGALGVVLRVQAQALGCTCMLDCGARRSPAYLWARQGYIGRLLGAGSAPHVCLHVQMSSWSRDSLRRFHNLEHNTCTAGQVCGHTQRAWLVVLGSIAFIAICAMPQRAPGGTAMSANEGLALVPLAGNVNLDVDPWTHRSVLSHRIAKERIELPPYFGCELFFDEDADDDGDIASMAIIGYKSIADGDPDIIVADSLLNQKVWQNGEQELFIEYDGAPVLSLNDADARRELLSVTLRCGPQLLECKWCAASLQRSSRFYGLRLYWCLHELYTNLALSSHQGHRWVWVSKCWDQWQKVARSLWPTHDGAFVKGASCDDGGDEAGMTQPDLPWPGVSTPGLLALLLRFWSSPSRQAGALSDAHGRSAAQQVLGSLLGALQGRTFDIKLLLDEGVKFEWPRPPQGEFPVMWVVTEDGTVDFMPEDRISEGLSDEVHRKWASDLGVDLEQKACLMELLHAIGAWRPRRQARRLASLGQVLLSLACEIESAVFGALVSPQDQLNVQRSDFNYATSSLQQVNGELLKYLHAQQLMFSPRPLMLSLANEKSRAHGLCLCSTVLALPSGRAAWAFPVVSRCSGPAGCQRSVVIGHPRRFDLCAQRGTLVPRGERPAPISTDEIARIYGLRLYGLRRFPRNTENKNSRTPSRPYVPRFHRDAIPAPGGISGRARRRSSGLGVGDCHGQLWAFMATVAEPWACELGHIFRGLWRSAHLSWDVSWGWARS